MKKIPIILSSPRAGSQFVSTRLLPWIEGQLKLRWTYDWFHVERNRGYGRKNADEYRQEHVVQLMKYYGKTSFIICPCHINGKIWSFLKHHFDFICVERQDTLQQVLSWCFAERSQRFTLFSAYDSNKAEQKTKPQDSFVVSQEEFNIKRTEIDNYRFLKSQIDPVYTYIFETIDRDDYRAVQKMLPEGLVNKVVWGEQYFQRVTQPLHNNYQNCVKNYDQVKQWNDSWIYRPSITDDDLWMQPYPSSPAVEYMIKHLN